MISPVNPVILRDLLLDSGFDRSRTQFLYEGFRDGFALGYEGDTDVQMTSPNLKLNIGTPTDLWNKVMKEVSLGRYAGPFEDPPFKHFIQSPIGLVPKDGGAATRLIFHLSYPRTAKPEHKQWSVNGNTPKHKTSVKYPDICDA